MKPVREMVRIAVEKDGMTKDEYNRRVSEYLDVYGDRCLEELKLETETFRTNPAMFEAKIREFAQDKEKLVQLLDEKKNEIDIKIDPLTKFLSNRCMLGIGNREIQRLNRSRIFGMVREAVLRMGEIYAKQNCIETKRDVFYLTLDELRSLADKPCDMRETVYARKKKYEMYSLLPAYSRIIFSEKAFDKNHRNINMAALQSSKDEMVGVPCSNGIVEGEAYIVTDVKKVESVKDKILITKTTDPRRPSCCAQRVSCAPRSPRSSGSWPPFCRGCTSFPSTAGSRCKSSSMRSRKRRTFWWPPPAACSII